MKTNSALHADFELVSRVMAGLLILSVASALAQTKSAASSDIHKWDHAAVAEVPAKARSRRNPLESDPSAVSAGRKLFAEHCSQCHGKGAEGGRRGSSLNVEPAHRVLPGELFSVLTNGVIRRGMPGWSKLAEPERWQLVSFLESLRDRPEP
jgi:mono/diheme cytochrome c family protein